MNCVLALLLLAPPAAVDRQHLERGFALAQAGNLQAAESELREAVKLAPNDPQALAVLGIVLSQQGKIAEGTPLLERACTLAPRNTNTRYNLALNQFRLGNKTGAKANLQRILREEPGHQQAAALLATLAQKTEQKTGQAGKQPDSYAAALKEYRGGRIAQSRALLEQMVNGGSKDPNVFHLLAWCHHRQGRRQEARSAMQQALELAPDDPELYTNAAQILLEQGDLNGARAGVDKALELAPDNAAAHKLSGTLSAAEGNMKAALASYQRAAELDRTDPETVERLGRVQLRLQQYAGSRQTLETGIARFPSYARLYNAYAESLLDPDAAPGADAEARAKAALQKALALDASLWEAHLQLGSLLLKQGAAAAAVPHLEAATKLDPGNAPAHFTLANAYRAAGRKADQARELQRYRELETQQANSGPARNSTHD